MKKRTRMTGMAAFCCLFVSMFSCKEKTEVSTDYEPILTSQAWVVTGATYKSPQNLDDLMLNSLKDHLDTRKLDYKRVTDIYALMKESFPCILDNTFRFDKSSQMVMVNTGKEPCVGADPFSNIYVYHEKAMTDLTMDHEYTVSFLPTRSESTWSLKKGTGELTIRENASRKYPTTSYWTIKQANTNQLVVEILFSFGYVYQDSNTLPTKARGSGLTLTLSPAK